MLLAALCERGRPEHAGLSSSSTQISGKAAYQELCFLEIICYSWLPKSKDKSAKTEAFRVALYLRPF
jgi:hypothetical protein